MEDFSYLFNEFDPVGKEAWKAQILKDIKAAAEQDKLTLYNQKMVWIPYEGMSVQPFYTAENVRPVSITPLKRSLEPWQNREYIPVTDTIETNQVAKDALKGGADALYFDFSTLDFSTDDLSRLLDGIKLAESPVSFFTEAIPLNFLAALKKVAPYQWRGTLYYDPVAIYMQKGSLPDQAFDTLSEAITQTATFPNFASLTIGSHHFHEAGATAVQELAFLINTLVEYVDQLTERGLPVDSILNKTELSLSVSTNYFMEIAKVRALRLLLQQVTTVYGVAIKGFRIHAQTSLWNTSRQEPYNNIIRTTIEAMAAIAGGCDALTVLPFTGKGKSSALGRHIARNTSIILKEESFFDKAVDMAAGAYYIDHLTNTLAQEAWQLFKEVEKKGGILKAFRDGFIIQEIEKVRVQKQSDLENGKLIVVGENKYTATKEMQSKEYFKKLSEIL